MTKKQKIKCNVESCKHQNCDSNTCCLDEICVGCDCPNNDKAKTEDQTICCNSECDCTKEENSEE